MKKSLLLWTGGILLGFGLGMLYAPDFFALGKESANGEVLRAITKFCEENGWFNLYLGDEMWRLNCEIYEP